MSRSMRRVVPRAGWAVVSIVTKIQVDPSVSGLVVSELTALLACYPICHARTEAVPLLVP